MFIHFWEKFPRVYDWIQILATGGFLYKVSKELTFLNGQSVIDVGCGTGTLLDYLTPKDYLGVDVNPDFIKLAQEKYPTYEFKVLDMIKEKFPKKNFQYIFIMNVLHHLGDDKILQMFAKIKKRQGFQELVIVESKPKNFLGKILGNFDAGRNFREYNDLLKIIKEDYKIKKTKIIRAPFGTYEYLLVRCVTK